MVFESRPPMLGSNPAVSASQLELALCECHRQRKKVSVRSLRSLRSLDQHRLDHDHLINKDHPKFCAEIGHTLADFAENTSAHGIPRAYTSRGRLRRFLWLLLFLCCCIAFTGQAVQIVKRFFRNDIIVGVELKFETIPFPSVTVCNLNPYKNSLAREMADVGDTLSAFDSAMASSSASSSASVPRLRKRRRLYTKYEGLLAVFSFCDCAAGTLGCRALKDEHQQDANGTRPLCLCFYNQQNEQVWPCFEPDDWLERRCSDCTPLGNCNFEYSNQGGGGGWPCLCAPAIRICVRVDEPVPPEINNKTISNAENDTTVSDNDTIPLMDRVPKIWELKKAEIPLAGDRAAQKEAREEAYGLRGVNDPIAIRAKAVENLVFAVSQLSEDQQRQMGYRKEEFITKCSFNGRACSVDADFSLYVDPTFGNCFTFNARRDTNVLSERAGPNYGLRFQVFVNVSDYLPTTEAAGVRITVHNPEEQPFPDTHGHSAPTGFVSSFGIRLKRVHRLPNPYGDCVQHGKTDEYIYRDKEYSTEGCQRSCIQRMLVRKCGCGDPRFPRYLNTSNCPVGDPRLRECLRRELQSAAHTARQPDCVCRQPCREQVFSITYSCARWPSGAVALHGAGDCDASLSGAQCLQHHREQSAIVEVYFEQLNYESLQESEAYGMPNLLSDFGGQLGLWMGVSVITIMEVGILASELLIRLIRRLIGGRHGTPSGTGPLLAEPRHKKRRRVLVHKGSAIQWIDADGDVPFIGQKWANGNGGNKYYSTIDDD